MTTGKLPGSLKAQVLNSTPYPFPDSPQYLSENEIQDRLRAAEKTRMENRDPLPFHHMRSWAKLKQPQVLTAPVPLYYDNGLDDHLYCPVCDGQHLHHISVELFNRCEDDSEGDHILLYVKESLAWNEAKLICPEEHLGDGNMSNTPSYRRTGITISFICEACHSLLKLHIAQHKGETQLFWSFDQ